MTQTLPFGHPVVRTRPLVTRLRSAECVAPVDLWRSLRRDPNRAGLCLFESAGAAGKHTTIRHSVLVTRALLRLELRGGEAVIEALTPEGEELARRLAPALEHCRDDSAVMDDDSRLRAGSVLDVVRRVAGAVVDAEDVGAEVFAPGLFGALAYDLVDSFERLPQRRPDLFDDPDLSMVLGTEMVVLDHESGVCSVITRGMPWEQASAVDRRHRELVRRLKQSEHAEPGIDGFDPHRGELPPVTRDVSDEVFRSGVARMREEIGRGEIFQGVLSRGITLKSAASSTDVYLALRSRNPSPYLFHLELGRGELLGASPELCLRVEGSEVELRPIAGTAARGLRDDGTLDRDLDNRLALELQLDRKEQAEHVMLLDLARNDIARVSVPGSMEVVEQFAIERFSHVQHLVSRVRGTLRAGFDALHAYRAVANMGTLTGAPKLRAMELIRAAEPCGRGFYGGAAGYLLANGQLETCIVIRSLRTAEGVYRTQAGAGVVWDSDPESELAETERKAYACREAVALAEGRAQ